MYKSPSISRKEKKKNKKKFEEEEEDEDIWMSVLLELLTVIFISVCSYTDTHTRIFYYLPPCRGCVCVCMPFFV